MKVARVFREILANGGILENGLVSDITGEDTLYSNLTAVSKNNWNLVFRKEGRYHYIRQEAIDYYNSL